MMFNSKKKQIKELEKRIENYKEHLESHYDETCRACCPRELPTFKSHVHTAVTFAHESPRLDEQVSGLISDRYREVAGGPSGDYREIQIRDEAGYIPDNLPPIPVPLWRPQ